MSRRHGRRRDRSSTDPLVIHTLPIDAVRGRAGQLLPDRRRPAHAGRHRPNSGKALVVSRTRSPRTAGWRTSSGSSSRTSTTITSGSSACSPTARARRSAHRSARAGDRGVRRARGAQRRARGGADAAPASARRGDGAARGLARFRGWGGSAAVTHFQRRWRAGLRRPHAAGRTGRGTRPRTSSSTRRQDCSAAIT